MNTIITWGNGDQADIHIERQSVLPGEYRARLNTPLDLLPVDILAPANEPGTDTERVSWYRNMRSTRSTETLTGANIFMKLKQCAHCFRQRCTCCSAMSAGCSGPVKISIGSYLVACVEMPQPLSGRFDIPWISKMSWICTDAQIQALCYDFFTQKFSTSRKDFFVHLVLLFLPSITSTRSNDHRSTAVLFDHTMASYDVEAGHGIESHAQSYSPDEGGMTFAASALRTPELWKQDVKREQAAVKPRDTPFLRKHGRTELQVFQTLVGVHFLAYGGPDLKGAAKQDEPASVMSDIFRPGRAAGYRHRNRGLYDRCISQDMKMGVMYSFSHYLISGLYLLQVLVAATLTAISASDDISSVPVTVLGAINTVLAGILAWLNGQGMPNRYRRARDQLREVVREIEASERMFAEIDFIDWPANTPRPTPISERNRLERLYNQAREDQEVNYPNAEKSPRSATVLEKAHTLEEKAKASPEIKVASSKMNEVEKPSRKEMELMDRERFVKNKEFELEKWATSLSERAKTMGKMVAEGRAGDITTEVDLDFHTYDIRG